MSRIFLILLIVLLPLRGWSAERMAVYMAASETATMVAADRAMPADCPMMMQSAGPSENSANQSGGKIHRGCQSCQLCMALAVFATEVAKTHPHKPLTAAMTPADRFASADLVRAAKPPIS